MDNKSKYYEIIKSFHLSLLNIINKSNSIENLCKILSDHGIEKNNTCIKNACFKRIIDIIHNENILNSYKYNHDKMISLIPINLFDEFMKYHWNSCYVNTIKNKKNNEIIEL